LKCFIDLFLLFSKAICFNLSNFLHLYAPLPYHDSSFVISPISPHILS